MSSQELLPIVTAEMIEPPITVSVTHQSGATATAILPQRAGQDARFIQMWLRNQQSDRTQETYAANITRFYRDISGSLSQVTLEDLQDYAESLYDLAPASQVLLLRTVKSALSFCHTAGFLPVNVGAAFRVPKLEDKLAQRILSEAQVIRLIALETERRNHMVLVVLYESGIRASELCDLRRRDLQENGESGQLTVAYGKRGKTRSILLQPEVWEKLQEYCQDMQPGAYVFQSRQSVSKTGRLTFGRLDESQVHRIVNGAAIRANIEVYTETIKRGKRAGEQVQRSRVSPHWLRHAHASHALRRGADIALVRDTLGHGSIETTGRYLHARPNSSSALFLPSVV